MKRVIMTIGPQYSGKSTFCSKVLEAFPEIVSVSRDRILMEMFGKVWLDTHSGGHEAAWERVWQAVQSHLAKPSITLLLDAWNAPASDRVKMLSKLRAAGAERVDGWYFVTPLETCTEWSMLRDPPGKGTTEEWTQIRRNNRISTYGGLYKMYHSQKIQKEPGFASIHKINALDPPTVESLLAL